MIVMVGAVGLALKDHGRGRTLKGLCGGAPRVVPAPVVGQPDPSGSVPCQASFTIMGRTPEDI